MPSKKKVTEFVQKPDVFTYTDYRSFLEDMYLFYKGRSPIFSHRYIAHKVMAGSAGWFPNVVSGRITLTNTYQLRIGRLFGLTRRETDYFEIIVKYGQTASIEEKSYYLLKIHECKGVAAQLLGRDKFEYYRHWYICAMRELLMIFDDDGSPERIAPMLRPPITRQEASEALATLRALNLVHMTTDGHLRPTNEVVRKDPAFSSVYWATNMHAKLTLALKAIDSIAKEERDFSEVVVPLSNEGMEEVRAEIGVLRKKILAISNRDTARDRVFQCSIQLFPLSKQIGRIGRGCLKFAL